MEGADISSAAKEREPRTSLQVHGKADHAAAGAALALIAHEIAYDPALALQRAADVARAQCKADAAGISILETEDEERVFRCIAVSGVCSVRVDDTVPARNSFYSRAVDQNGELHFAQTEQFVRGLRAVEKHICERLCVPLRVGGIPIGALWVLRYHPTQVFGADDVHMLKAVADLAAAAYRSSDGAANKTADDNTSGVPAAERDVIAKAFHGLRRQIRQRERDAQASRDLQRRLINAQEEERQRISRELHDQLGQRLSLLGIKLALLKKQEYVTDRGVEEITKLEAFVREIDDDLDFLVWELRPTALDDLGLVESLGEFADSWSRHWGVEVEVTSSGPDTPRMSLEVEAVLYRVAQEALNNVIKHAKAKHVTIDLARQNKCVTMLVRDDGVGYVPSAPRPGGTGGFGLLGIRERVSLVGGTVEVNTKPGHGTTVSVMIPIPMDGE